jgi:hypothetical protein
VRKKRRKSKRKTKKKKKREKKKRNKEVKLSYESCIQWKRNSNSK